jgi:hypothetical protein
MIVKTLRSGSMWRQLFLFLLLVVAAMVSAYRRGVTIIQPEESSVIYMFISQWISSLPELLQYLILTLLLFLNIFLMTRVGKIIGVFKGKIVVHFFFATLSVLILPSNVAIQPPMIAMLLFTPALISVLSASGARNSGVRIFNAGFLLALATLVAHPLLLMVPGFFVVLLATRFYKWNYWAILLVGVALPWIYVITLGWVFSWYPGPGLYAVTGIYLSGVLYFTEFLKASLTLSSLIIILAMILLLVPAILTIFSRLDQKVIAVRYLYRAMLWIFLFTIPVTVVSGGSMQYFLFAGFFVVIILSEYIHLLRRTLIIDIILGIVIITGIFGHLHLF